MIVLEDFGLAAEHEHKRTPRVAHVERLKIIVEDKNGHLHMKSLLAKKYCTMCLFATPNKCIFTFEPSGFSARLAQRAKGQLFGGPGVAVSRSIGETERGTLR
jgi:hypothetical protein